MFMFCQVSQRNVAMHSCEVEIGMGTYEILLEI